MPTTEKETAGLPANLRPRLWTPFRLLVTAGFLSATLGPGVFAWWTMVRMPGSSFDDELPPLTPAQEATAETLRSDVSALSALGVKSVERPAALAAAASLIELRFTELGHDVTRVGSMVRGVDCDNLEVALPHSSASRDMLIIGAHYDSAHDSPGANDNGSGVAALLALAERFGPERPLPTPVRLVAFVNEEMPHFRDGTMGSQTYAQQLIASGAPVRAMLSLETMGYYDDEPGSQLYPFPLSMAYPDTGNFIAFVGDEASASLVRASVGHFREDTAFPSEGAALPADLPGIGWSDHRSFWEQGVAALMVTDTALFRYPDYHQPTDTPERIDYERLARVVDGLEDVVVGLARELPEARASE